MAAHADVPPHLWWGFDFVSGLAVRERLNQGPFDVDTITYDHGELFGEDGYFGHGPIQHPKVLEVPFVEGKLR